MDLGTNLRGFGHKPSWIWAQTGLEGPGFRFFTVFRRRRGARVQVFQRFCAQIHEGLCPNPRRFVPKSTKVCAQIHEGHEHYKGSRLRGFGHKPSWIWAQTFVDLGTNLRGFGHKPSWIWAQTFVDLGTSRPRRARVRVSQRFSSKCFSWFFRWSTGCLAFSQAWGLQGSSFSLFFFHGLEGPGFRIFTGSSKGQGSVFSLAFQVFHRLFSFFVGVGAPGFKFFTVFFSRAGGARVQDFHWPLEGPGFRFFTGFECCSREGWGKFEPSQDQGSGFSRAGSGGQGSGFSLASGPQGSGFLRFFMGGLGGPGFRFFTGVGAPGFGFSRAGAPGFGLSLFFSTGSRGQGSGFSLHGLEGPGFGIFTGVSKGSGFSLGWSVVRGRVGEKSNPRRARVRVFHGRARGARVQVFHWRRGRARGARVQDSHRRLEWPGFGFSLVWSVVRGRVGEKSRPRRTRVRVFHGRARGARVKVFHWRRGYRFSHQPPTLDDVGSVFAINLLIKVRERGRTMFSDRW